MDRRNALKWLAGTGLATVGAPSLPTLSAQERQARRGLPEIQITDVKSILTAPPGLPRTVIVKVETSEPGLYGYGCATFTQRAKAVVTAVDEFLRPFLKGKNPDHIEDIWQTMYVSSYWRNGPVLYNAMSGVDQALWDIKGKRANMPVYALLGGKARNGADVYRHASGTSAEEVEERARAYIEEGVRHVRIQVGIPGNANYGAQRSGDNPSGFLGAPSGGPHLERMYEPTPYLLSVPKLFAHMRKNLGDKIELLHDVHERISNAQAMWLLKRVEEYRPFFIEDPVSPEQIGYFRHMRSQTTTAIAMGELFNSPHEFTGLITERLIDFIRVHISQIGGLTPARKLAALCEWFGVRTAWHGPGDTSPVGHLANIALDVSCYNFGIQEARTWPDSVHEVFQGCPRLENGFFFPNESPGCLAVAGAIVVGAGLGVLPILHLSLIGALAVVGMGVLRPGEAKDAIDFDVIVVIGAAFGLAAAVEGSGLGQAVADVVAGTLGGFGPQGALAGIVLATVALSSVITNNAAAALVLPIALSTATDFGIDPRTAAVAVALSASASFMTPVSYQTNLMVYGPGGYRFGDYLRLGTPLVLAVLAVILATMPS